MLLQDLCDTSIQVSTIPDQTNMQVPINQAAFLNKSQEASTQHILTLFFSSSTLYLDISTSVYEHSLVVQIFQFQVAYEIADVTIEIRNKMATAIHACIPHFRSTLHCCHLILSPHLLERQEAWSLEPPRW